MNMNLKRRTNLMRKRDTERKIMRIMRRKEKNGDLGEGEDYNKEKRKEKEEDEYKDEFYM